MDGIVDFFEKHKIKIFGPRKSASQLEGSKTFTKKICKKYKIPTARFAVLKDSKSAKIPNNNKALEQHTKTQQIPTNTKQHINTHCNIIFWEHTKRPQTSAHIMLTCSSQMFGLFVQSVSHICSRRCEARSS